MVQNSLLSVLKVFLLSNILFPNPKTFVVTLINTISIFVYR